MGGRGSSVVLQLSDYGIMLAVGVLLLDTQILSSRFYPEPVYNFLFADLSIHGLQAPGLFWLLAGFIAVSSLGRVVADSSIPRRIRKLLDREDYLDRHGIKRFDE